MDIDSFPYHAVVMDIGNTISTRDVVVCIDTIVSKCSMDMDNVVYQDAAMNIKNIRCRALVKYFGRIQLCILTLLCQDLAKGTVMNIDTIFAIILDRSSE